MSSDSSAASSNLYYGRSIEWRRRQDLINRIRRLPSEAITVKIVEALEDEEQSYESALEIVYHELLLPGRARDAEEVNGRLMVPIDNPPVPPGPTVRERLRDAEVEREGLLARLEAVDDRIADLEAQLP